MSGYVASVQHEIKSQPIIDAVSSATTMKPDDSTIKNYSVYYLEGPSLKKRYYGITNNPRRRLREHRWSRKDRNINMTVILTGLSKNEARVAETIIIAAYTKELLDNSIFASH